MADILDELVLQMDLESKDFRSGELAVVAGLDRLTEMMEQVAAKFDDGGKKASASLDKTGKKATQTGKEMEAAGKKASSFFSSVRTQVLALAGVSLSLAGLKNFVTGFTGKLNEMATQADAFGMSAKSLDGWIKAGQSFGVTANEIAGAFSRINDTKARLASGLGLDPQLQMLLRAAGQAGVNIDITHDSTEEVMRKLAQVFPKLTKAQQQAYGSSLGWGYAGQQWLSSGHALRDVDTYTARSGVTDRDITAARRFRQEWAQIEQSFEKTGYVLFSALLPYVGQFNNWLQELANWAAKHPDEIREKVEKFVAVIGKIAGNADDAAKAIGGWKHVVEILIGLKLASWLWKVWGAFSAIGKLKFPGLAAGTSLAGGAAVAAGVAIASEPFVDKALNQLFGQNDYFQRVRTASNWSDFGTALLGNGDARWIDGKWTDNRGQHTQSATQHAQSAKAPHESKGAVLLRWLDPEFAKNEAKYGLPSGLLRAVAMTESGGDQFAVSGAGAKGLFQFMDGTARDMGLKGDDVFDPHKSAAAAARYLSQLMTIFHGDLGKALSAYNWGAGNVMRKGLGAAPEETRQYVPRVLAHLPRPGARLSSQYRGAQAGNSVTQSTHIGTLNVTTSANNVKGITEDAHRKISRSSLAMNYASGVSG